jgi:hypothetical protein
VSGVGIDVVALGEVGSRVQFVIAEEVIDVTVESVRSALGGDVENGPLVRPYCASGLLVTTLN